MFVVLVLVVTAREERLAARCLPPFGIARARRKHGRFSMRCSCQVRLVCVGLGFRKELRPRQAAIGSVCAGQ